MKILTIILLTYSINAVAMNLSTYDADKELDKALESCINAPEMTDCMTDSQETISNMELIIEETKIAHMNNEFEDQSTSTDK